MRHLGLRAEGPDRGVEDGRGARSAWRGGLGALARCLSLVLGGLVALAPAALHAQEDVDALLAEGAALREDGDDAAAIERFARAFEASGQSSGQAVAEMALAERALERWLDAARHFEAALELGGDWVEPLRANLERARDDVYAHVARLEVTTEIDGATLEVDGEPVGALPLARPVLLEPGRHTVRVLFPPVVPEGAEAPPEDAEPRVVEREVEIGEGELRQSAFEVETSLPEPPPEDDGVDDAEGAATAGSEAEVADVEEEDDSDWEDSYPMEEPIDTNPSTTVWALSGVAAVGLVAGTVFGFVMLSEQSAFDDLIAEPTLPEEERQEAEDIARRGETFALLADLSFGVTLAAGATALVLYIVEQDRRRAERDAEDDDGEDDAGEGDDGEGDDGAEESAAVLVPWASPTGGGVALGGRF
jgi:hypothetical protein